MHFGRTRLESNDNEELEPITRARIGSRDNEETDPV